MREKTRNTTFPLFKIFVEFLVAESELACDPVLPLAAVKATAGKSLSNNSRHTVHNTHIGQNKKFCVFL